MTTYNGYDVLDATTPNRANTGKVAFSRVVGILDSSVGHRTWDDHDNDSIPDFTFSWMCFTRADILALKSFLDSRHGRVVPVWVPTYSRDLILTGDIVIHSTSFTISDTGYSKHQFPHTARRNLAFIAADGSMVCKKALSAVNNGNGTETLTVDTEFNPAITASSTLVSFLVLSRLTDDMAVIVWHNKQIAECNIHFVELPKETPA